VFDTLDVLSGLTALTEVCNTPYMLPPCLLVLKVGIGGLRYTVVLQQDDAFFHPIEGVGHRPDKLLSSTFIETLIELGAPNVGLIPEVPELNTITLVLFEGTEVGSLSVRVPERLASLVWLCVLTVALDKALSSVVWWIIPFKSMSP
jgi:hypothetical protein